MSLFFSNSYKCQLELEKHISSLEDTTAKKLVSLYKTQWVARIDALDVFFDLFPAVIKTLEVISEGSTSGWNAEACKSAENLVICKNFCVHGCIHKGAYHITSKESQRYLPGLQ